MGNNELTSVDRSASVLTPAQREYLRGKEVSEDSERAYRGRIRERLHASLFDYSLITHQLPLEDIDKAFAEPVEPEAGTALPVANAIPDIISLLYIAHRDHETVDSENTHEGWYMEHFVETGIENALNRLGVSYGDVDVSITVERGEPLATLADGELTSLSTGELKQLLIAGEIDSEEFAEATIAKAE